MKNLNTFQSGVLIGFAVLAAIGVWVFATGINVGGDAPLPPVEIWGVVDADVMEGVIEGLQIEGERYSQVSYVEKDPRTYNEEFVNALAAGRGPDLILIPQSMLFEHFDKLAVIPFDAYSEREFRNTFIEAGEVFLGEIGPRALPFAVDPMVMYWNRDILTAGNVANPPGFWDEFFVLSPRLTVRDQASNIVRSFVALGEYQNVSHAKDILSALILQTGNPIIGRTANGQFVSALTERFDFLEPPALAALRFYTEFSNPVKSVYSWNRALPNARTSFASGDLAIYFGFASEYALLRSTNPNLNFDVAAFPRSRDADRPITFGNVMGFAIPRGATDANAAFEVAQALTENPQIAHFSELTGLPPVRRDLLAEVPSDSIGPVFYGSALAARSWIDPNPEATNGIYQRMIESTTSGRARLNEAIDTAHAELNNLLR
jgi:ABC-type glycerol-3-phosphate transport system substrate-binding protein